MTAILLHLEQMLADSCSCVRTCGLELLLVASLTQLDCTVGNNAAEWYRARASDATAEGSCTWRPEHHLPSIMQPGHGIRGGRMKARVVCSRST